MSRLQIFVSVAFVLFETPASAQSFSVDPNEGSRVDPNGPHTHPPTLPANPPVATNPPPIPPPEPPLSRYMAADHSYRMFEPGHMAQTRVVHQLGWLMPFTVSTEHVQATVYGLTYALKWRSPYDRLGLFQSADAKTIGILPTSAIIGNEIGLETRLLANWRTHSGFTSTFSLAVTSNVRRKDFHFTFPSLLGALLPEVGLILLSPVEQGAPYRTELYVRHIARFQYLFGTGILALDGAPFVQLSFPLDHGPKRVEAGFVFGISCQIPPKNSSY